MIYTATIGRRRSKERLAWTAAILALIISGGSCSRHDYGDAISAIEIGVFSNSDLIWMGTPFGIHVELSDAASNHVQTNGYPPTKELVVLLDDSHRFALAHVLLTNKYGQKFDTSSEGWNGLPVRIEAGVDVSVSPKSQEAIRSQWIEFLRVQGD